MPRHREPYTLYKRRIRPGLTVYYFRTYDSKGRRLPGRSTGKSAKADARDYCDELMAAGHLANPELHKLAPAPTLREWAKSDKWWQWGESGPECRYLRAQLARSDEDKPAVSRRYADDALRDLKKWILPYHGKKRLDEITPKDCEQLLFDWQKEGLSRKSVNNKASIHRIMLGEAARLGVITENPWIRVKGFTPGERPKGTLSLAEYLQLMHPDQIPITWNGNPMYYSASLLASVTGMRLGEVLALKRADVFPDHVHVAHSWSAKYGRGRTKTKRVDDVVIPRQVHEMILSWCTWEGFVFSFSNGQRPCSGNRLAEAFPKAMRAQGIPTVDEHGRPRTFHGWRNFANSYFLARGISGEKTRQIIRHETDEMTQHYATGFRLEDWKDVAAAQEQLVGPLALTGGTEDRA